MTSPTGKKILHFSFLIISLAHLLPLSASSPAAIITPYAVAAAGNSTPTVYEALEEYGFPIGILPKGITRYELDRATGKFAVYLNKTCTFTIDGYSLRYRTKITGVISYQKLTNLSGVQVKILFLWLGIGEVSVAGNDMDFSVGIASADFPLNNFYESPQCGCGFDCVDHGRRRRRFGWKHLVSSS
ncbi:OLC1v1004321C1 [Oldenlandia corymbosa var. corymbosa]|uniref:OLC1v1004321C1 n=1 Tax=Oldenlandia corymbosa var. corymbosa TaxID=529605 RepID=A0AAV1DCS8_OLDCO|nr:OLC1v1004321C1 [Oldenlandia corymbosa var. corymbosa]